MVRALSRIRSVRRLAAAVAAVGVAGCEPSPPLPPVEPSPLVRPASTVEPAFSARLTELLALADVELETRTIDFANLTDASMLGTGWALEPTLGQAWGTGDGSELVFQVMPARELTIAFRCAPFHFPGSATQFLTLRVNGTEVETVRLWKMMRGYSVRVPAEALHFGANRLELTYAYAAVPERVLAGSDDDRELAVLFEHFHFGEAPHDPVAEPLASRDGTRLHLPFASRVNFYLELGRESSFRLAGAELWRDETRGPEPDWRLRLEAEVSGRDDIQVVELGPEQLALPVEVALPVFATGERVRIAVAAISAARPDSGPPGLTLDLPEVISLDAGLAARRALATRVARAAGPSSPPNVLVYMIDTLRADHLGAYGYDRPTSPEIDAFAAGATLFRRAVAQSSWTKPAVATVLTGLNPQLHGVNQRQDALADEAVTLAETLWEAGYDTGAIYTNGNLSHMGLGQGFAHYEHLREGATRAIHVLSDELNDEAFRWLDRRDRSKPFFLYLHATDPHAPYTPPAGFLERLGLEVDDPEAGDIENVKRLRRNVVDERQLSDLVALYDAEIAANDLQFGRLLRELERLRLLDSTLIVLVSDHGEEFFDHGWWQHGKTLYQEQLAVPLIIRFPGGEGAGRVVEAIAQHIDILPTVLDVAGLEAPEGLPGHSLRRWLASDPPEATVHAVSYLDVDDRVAESLTSTIGKLVLHHYDVGRSRLLFDLASDPGERHDLYSTRPVLAGYLTTALKAFHLTQQVRLTPEQGEFDAEVVERLKALGYLN